MSTFSGKVRRNATNIAIVIVMVAAGTILYIQSLATAQLQQQVAQQQQIINQVKDLSVQLNTRASERTRQIDEVNHHLDCIVIFFTQKDRSQKAIDNIDTCTVKNVSTGQVTQPVPNKTVAQQQLQPTVSPQVDIFSTDIERIKHLINGL